MTGVRRSSELARALVACLAGIVVVLAVVACSSQGSDEAESGPGSDEVGPDARGLDTTPFTLAAPNTTGGPTTLPPEVDPSRASDAPQPTTTTTLPLSTIPALPPGEITLICGFEQTVESFHGLNFKDAEEAQVLLTRLPSVLAQYRDAAPPTAKDDLTAVIPSFEELRDVMAANDWDPSSSAVTDLVGDLSSGELPGQLERIVAVEEITCR